MKTAEKMTVIINIQQMQRIIGVSVMDTNFALENRSYEYLHNYQNDLLKHYNNAINNREQFNNLNK